MPYTPPSQQSPAASKPTTPVLSRSHSHSENGPRSPITGRPSLPRSNSSTSYLRMHRRSPSTGKSDGSPPTPTEAPNSDTSISDYLQNGSVRQSPPPVNNNTMPTGAVLSPPDSSENSDGEDNAREERGRELQKTWAELHEAVRSINLKRDGSPNKVGTALTVETTSEPVSQVASPTALTKEARKISHSRSSTEMITAKPTFESASGTSDEDEEEDGSLSKPSLVRKKSGELVKPALRPSSRRRYSSMPGTPTYAKSVHFNETENQTRHFLQVDKPIAVSAGSSPVEQYDSESEFPFDTDGKGEREIKLANFPDDTFERKISPVRVERIFLSADKQTLIGVCAVQNISFQKLVVARFTVDYWKTTSEVVAEYNNDPKGQNPDGCDRFNFHIKLSDQANIDDKTLLLCVRYNVGGQEFWDNNNSSNYQVDFSNASKSTKPAVNGLGTRPPNAIPRSRHSPSTSARDQRESLDDDFSTNNGTFQFGSPEQLMGDQLGSIKLKPRAKRGSVFPQPAANGLGGRYDFGASLTAALNNVQDKRNSTSKPSGGSYFGPIERVEGPTKTVERPDAITTDRPAMGSEQYKDLVQKFCYFTPGAGKANPPQPSTAPSSNPAKPATGADGANDAGNSTSSSPTDSYGGPSPQKRSSVASPLVSPRSASPVPVTGGGMGGRAASPISFGYPYHQPIRDGYLSDSPTPTAIQG